MLLSHVDVIDQLLKYPNNPGEEPAPIQELEADPESEDCTYVDDLE